MEDIFQKDLSGEMVSPDELNTGHHTPDEVRDFLSRITGREIDPSVTLLPPFYVDFGKNMKYMHKIEKAPFWGIRKHIRVSSIDSGVNTNANGQALDADGNVIEGLYCVGNLGGTFYGGADYPFHQTGLSLGRCYTFGMIAAKHALGQL